MAGISRMCVALAAAAIVMSSLFCANMARAESGPARLLRLLAQAPQEIAFVEATSKTLLRSGQVDFAAAVELDLNATPTRLSLDELSALPPDKGPRFALIFDVAEARVSRRVVKLTSAPSTVFLGFSGAPLSVPPDDPARAAQGFSTVAQAASPVASALGQPTPMGQPIMLDYAYRRATIQARRQMTAYVYVVDRTAGSYVRTTVDAFEQRRFEVAYGVSRLDPRRAQIRDQFDSETAVGEFENGELLVALSAILEDATKEGAVEPYADLVGLRRTILSAQNRTLETLAANRFDARPLNDPRFDAVVAVYTGRGALGSGFYVTPDVVMTNWHVVEDHPFVEMKLYDGRETFGQVLGKDARLDVALIRVEHRGRPVAFHTGRILDVGAQVEAIGHPQGYEFSITRGVVSALRRHASINLPDGAGEEVLYVQTDAPISPGNSGGPLFLGERVIGMNTWTRLDGQNLNFSIHYGELLNFLNEHLPGYRVDAAAPPRPGG